MWKIIRGYLTEMRFVLSLILALFITQCSVATALAPVCDPPKPPPPRPVQMIATAYTQSEKEGTEDGITKKGTKVRPGVVAVDPDVIPLGTKLYIENMGWFTAEDIGGGIKGNRVDIFFECYDEAIQFGIRPVQVWVQHPSMVQNG